MAATLTVETGAGTNTACNSYLTLAEVTAYHEEMGNAAWAAAAASPDNARITAIIRGCRAIDRLYVLDFIGRPANYGVQAMQWPRVGATITDSGFVSVDDVYPYGYTYPSDAIPAEVKKACCEAALVELLTPGEMNPNLDRGGQIKSVRAGSVSVDFEDGASALTKRTGIEGILARLLTARSTQIVLG